MGHIPAFVLIRQVANKAVSPDRRGRAVLEVFGFLKIIGIFKFTGSPCAR
jgi:hypothetical protein